MTELKENDQDYIQKEPTGCFFLYDNLVDEFFSKTSPEAILLYVAISRFTQSDEDLTFAKMGDCARLTPPEIADALDELEKVGLIRRTKSETGDLKIIITGAAPPR